MFRKLKKFWKKMLGRKTSLFTLRVVKGETRYFGKCKGSSSGSYTKYPGKKFAGPCQFKNSVNDIWEGLMVVQINLLMPHSFGATSNIGLLSG
jgi:hypothetical protein